MGRIACVCCNSAGHGGTERRGEIANEQLRAALARAGLEVEDLADRVDVDSKTVARWLGGRTPHPRYRTKVAAALACEEHQLWPELAEAARSADDRRDMVGIYAHAGDVRVPDWRALLHDARHQIDLLDYTLSPILTSPGATKILAEKAEGGCAIRILIAHPKSIWVASLAQQLGQDRVDDDGNTALDRELTLSRKSLQTLLGRPGIELRTFWAERCNTILRFDEQMLVTLHLFATPASRAPLLHLRRSDEEGLFAQFALHLDTLIRDSSERVEPANGGDRLPSGRPEVG